MSKDSDSLGTVNSGIRAGRSPLGVDPIASNRIRQIVAEATICQLHRFERIRSTPAAIAAWLPSAGTTHPAQIELSDPTRRGQIALRR